MSKIIAISGLKGGVGKSTVTYALVKEFQKKYGNDKVNYTDLDRQSHVLDEIDNEDAIVTIVDTPGALDAQQKVCEIADFIIVLTKPSPFDMEPLMDMMEIVQNAKKPHLVIINTYHDNYLMDKQYYEWFQKTYPNTSLLALRESTAFPMSVNYNMSICDYDKHSTASYQINELVNSLIEEVLQ